MFQRHCEPTGRRFAPTRWLAMTESAATLRYTILSPKPPKTSSKSVSVKQATLDLLRAFGIKKVFGNPGSTELPFLADWPDDIDYVLGPVSYTHLTLPTIYSV